MFRQLVLEPVTDTALPAMTVLRSFAEQDNVKLLTATEYNCTVHMFRQLGLEPVTDAVLPAMRKLEAFQNKTVPISDFGNGSQHSSWSKLYLIPLHKPGY